MENNMFIEEFRSLIMNNQIVHKYGNLYDMKKELNRKFPNQHQQMQISQAFEIVRKELLGDIK
ncbi:hypothetical protein [Rummeliibacillus sp. TYF-LIM-RU47]|uniref:hypothetical protein n=1 Tax=Rummeliibacillus sp. TYF-LIM-RU47 TaxID=2608406 RepID=UPI001239B6F4|nr:hypothetical protein [Rummeliibacillus sp. TYF-LIM-RU47]